MNDKIKACCENCDKCDKRDFRCSQTGSLVNKCEYCSYYYGIEQTPDQRIAELETRVQQFERKKTCVKENAEKLDAKESEVQNG